MGANTRREYAALWHNDRRESFVIFKDDLDDCWYVDFQVGTDEPHPDRAVRLANALNQAET